MNKSFDDWWEENHMNVSADRTEAFDIYSLGQQSKQAEVDELKREMLNKTNDAYADGQKSMRKMIKSNEDELQKRIDRAVEHIEDYYGVVELSMIVDILNGEQS